MNTSHIRNETVANRVRQLVGTYRSRIELQFAATTSVDTVKWVTVPPWLRWDWDIASYAGWSSPFITNLVLGWMPYHGIRARDLKGTPFSFSLHRGLSLDNTQILSVSICNFSNLDLGIQPGICSSGECSFPHPDIRSGKESMQKRLPTS